MKMEPKVMSSKQKWEPAAVARKYRIPVKIVREVALSLGKDGKYCRSLKKIYAALEEIGYVKGGVPKINIPEDTSAPDLSGQGLYVNE